MKVAYDVKYAVLREHLIQEYMREHGVGARAARRAIERQERKKR